MNWDVGVRFLVDVNVTIKQRYVFRIFIIKKIWAFNFLLDNIFVSELNYKYCKLNAHY
jgi:hypothetical protein